MIDRHKHALYFIALRADFHKHLQFQLQPEAKTHSVSTRGALTKTNSSKLKGGLQFLVTQIQLSTNYGQIQVVPDVSNCSLTGYILYIYIL